MAQSAVDREIAAVVKAAKNAPPTKWTSKKKPKAKEVSAMTRGEKVIAFIETYCKVPEGAGVGQPIQLDEFQKKFILDVYDNPHVTSRAILSIARKNGKTALIGGIGLAHIVGPEAKQNSQIVSGAQSRDQAALVFKLMSKMIALEPKLRAITRIVPSTKTILGLPRNVEYRAIAAEGKTAHGLSPVLAILDEVGQVRGPQSPFIDAIETSQGAHENPMLMTISTQAASDSDLLSIWIDDAKNSQDPHIVCHVYQADKDCDVMDEKQWVKSNPALGTFRSVSDMRRLAEKASRMPSFKATFRNLNLNQRVETYSPFISRDVWLSNSAPAKVPEAGKKLKVWGGLDLSAVSDLTALVLTAEEGSVYPTSWRLAAGIKEKAKQDRAPPSGGAHQKFLELTPGKSIQYEYIAQKLRVVFDTFDVQKIGFDRYNMKFLKPWLEKAKFTEKELEKFVEFGQGFLGISPALRELEVRLLEEQLKHGGHPVLTMCAANAVALSDPAGNRKLAKNKSVGRIDGMVALTMAIGVMMDEVKPAPGHKLIFI